jgi:hypothetical protein
MRRTSVVLVVLSLVLLSFALNAGGPTLVPVQAQAVDVPPAASQGEVFRHLEHFKIGDPITIYAGQRASIYTATDKFVVQEKGVPYAQRLENAKWIASFPDERVTLMSCWPYTGNTHRIFIIAKPARAG